MKHFKQFWLVVLVALASCVTANAYDFLVEGVALNILSEDELTCEVTYIRQNNYTNLFGKDKIDYEGSDIQKIKPAVEYKGKTYTVSRIGDYAFYRNIWDSSLIVEIPDYVESIGVSAFEGARCKEIVLPRSVKKIGKYAFSNCDVETVRISDLRAWYEIEFEGLSSNPMMGCNGCKLLLNEEMVTSLEVPADITEIKAFAFAGWNTLKKIHIPGSVKKIGDYAFYLVSRHMAPHLNGEADCVTLKIDNGVEAFGNFSFSKSDIDYVNIYDSVKEIGTGAFTGCNHLTSIGVWGNLSPNTLCNYTDLYWGGQNGELYDHYWGKLGTLIQYPLGRSSQREYEVKAKRIGYGAFAGLGNRCLSLKKVDLQKSHLCTDYTRKSNWPILTRQCGFTWRKVTVLSMLRAFCPFRARQYQTGFVSLYPKEARRTPT